MNVTKDGNYNITQKNGRHSTGTLYVSGTLGAATLTLNSLVDGVLTPLTDGALATDSQYSIEHGKLADIVLVVASSDGSTDFNIQYNGGAN